MGQKRILLTGGGGMLAYDFLRTQAHRYDIIPVDRETCDITKRSDIVQNIEKHTPDIVINCAAYTVVDDAEDIGKKQNFDINTLGTYYLAQITNQFHIDFITISTDYVFDGQKESGYFPHDVCNPINSYGMAKYLAEELVLNAHPSATIVRTSWLHGGEIYDGDMKKKGVYKNFVNTMLRLSETHQSLKIVDDQHGRPTSCEDLSHFLTYLLDLGKRSQRIYHFTSPRPELAVTWADFAEEIFAKYQKSTHVVRCTSAEYPTKAVRPKWSILLP